jgi:4-amino-4-deoxy-L-arabinose transferase-like glycosyltransferase
MRPVLGLLLVFMLTAPWHYLIWKAGGLDAQGRTWVQEYILRQHIGRFRGLDTVHNAPLPMYFVYFLLGFFPWSCFALAAFRREEPGEASGPAFHRFLLVWFWTIFVFFSLGAAKLPTYIVPAYPAAALLVGRWLDGALASGGSARQLRSLQRGALGALVTAALLAAVALFVPPYLPPKAAIPASAVTLIRAVTLPMLAGCLAAWFYLQRGQEPRWRWAGFGALAAVPVALFGVGCTLGYAVAARDLLGPYQKLAAVARPDAEAGLPIVVYNIIPRRPSMLYYARYAQLERKERPLLPFLRPFLNSAHPEADVLLPRRAWTESLQSELADAPDMTARVLRQVGDERGGWLLLRISLRSAPPGGAGHG